MRATLLLCIAFGMAPTCTAFSAQVPRRSLAAGAGAVAAWVVGGRAGLAASPALKQLGSLDRGLQTCGGRSGKNCLSSTDARSKVGYWKWPSSLGREDALAQLQRVLESYPQEGQAGIDGSGWSVAQGSLSEGYMRVEFVSKVYKFVDDLEFRAEADRVAVRSASREGGYDFGVNQVRLRFFTAALKKEGWDVKKL